MTPSAKAWGIRAGCVDSMRKRCTKTTRPAHGFFIHGGTAGGSNAGCNLKALSQS